jgi:adenylate cyclase
VHWGEVYVAEGRIFGDAVNVAARLQDHAQPGWVVISEAVHVLLPTTIMPDVHELGELELRNIARPVRAYSINANAVHVALPMPRPPRHALPSIAVLPLQNLGGDPADDYFADGIVEDIILSLAGLRELFVIARSSTLAFRGISPDVRQVGRALGVRYVLSGNLRRSARALRVTFQLSDVQSGAIVWSERMDPSLGDVFEMQDEVVRKVVTGIAPNIRTAEMQRMLRKRPESFTAYDLTLRALHALNDLSYDNWLDARRLLEMAMSEDPTFAMPVAWYAWWYSLHIGQGWSGNVADDTASSLRLARKAIALDGNNAIGLAMLGHLLGYLSHEPEAALPYFSRAIDACPNSALAWMYSSNAFAYLGRGQEALSRARYALQLSPEDQHRFLIYARLGIAHYTLGAYEEAAHWMRLSHMQCPTYTTALKGLIAALGGLGRRDEARGFAATLMMIEPGISLSNYEHSRVPFKDGALRVQFVEHLRQASLPP